MTPLLSVDDLVRPVPPPGAPPTRPSPGQPPGAGRGSRRLVGESGCGKSTLARAVCGLTPPAAGPDHLRRHTVRPLRCAARSRPSPASGWSSQDPYGSSNPAAGWGAQIADASAPRPGGGEAPGTVHPGGLPDPGGLAERAAQPLPGRSSSGGQRQRSPSPARLAARSPAARRRRTDLPLDASARSKMARLSGRWPSSRAPGCCFNSHDLSVVRLIADRIAVMYLGGSWRPAPPRRSGDNPRHPYTQALLAAYRSPTGREMLPANFRDVPDPADPPERLPLPPPLPTGLRRLRPRGTELIAGGSFARLEALSRADPGCAT